MRWKDGRVIYIKKIKIKGKEIIEKKKKKICC